MARWQSCNVLNEAADRRELWQFRGVDGGYQLDREYRPAAQEALPSGVIAKDWSSLWRRNLNVAWLASERVFLRVVHLPATDLKEVRSMVELQMEKLSPFPVAQIVWTIEVLPQKADALSTVIVVIAERSHVEEFLGRIEAQGFQADRLEAPFLDQILATVPEADGVWLYPMAAGTDSVWLAAWWYGGVLRHLGRLTLPPGENRQRLLEEQFAQMAWAGELEGWLESPPRWFVMAPESTAGDWVPLLTRVVDQPVKFLQPEAGAQLAARTAERAARNDQALSLLPADYATRYRQLFIDRLWMRGLGAVVMVYLLLVVAYFGVLQYLQYRVGLQQKEVSGLSGSYTNALQIRAQVQVLQEQLNLKYAGLDCWKAAAENLPTDLTLTQMIFSRGKQLRLQGTVAEDQSSQLFDYNEAMRKVAVNGQPLFSKVTPPTSSARPGSPFRNWTFECELKRFEAE